MSGREGKQNASPEDLRGPHTHSVRNQQLTKRRSESCSPRSAQILQTSDAWQPEGRRHPNAQTRTQLTQLEPPHSHGEAEQRHETKVDTEAGMLSGVSRKRSIRSNPCWFTEFCKSQCLSHFAAPFIVVRAETSVAESCENALNNLTINAKEKIQKHKVWSKTVTAGQERIRNPNLAYRPRDPTRRTESPSAISLSEIQVK